MDVSLYLNQLIYLAPEMALTAASIAAIIAHLAFKKLGGARIGGFICLAGIVAATIALAVMPFSTESFFSGTIILDEFARYFKVLILIVGAITILLTMSFYKHLGNEPGEIYYLILMALTGMMLAVSAVELITLYISIELFGIISYMLAGIFKNEIRSTEAGIKYFILGIVSSSILVLGMSLIYAITGETFIKQLPELVTHSDRHLVLAGMSLIFVGLFFKIALVPFHMWTPDVYEGAPTPVVVMFSTAPKAAAFGVIMRLIVTIFSPVETDWRVILSGIAIVSMFWGNIAALMQDNIKRMMAYSSIAHAGYIMIGVTVRGELGTMALLFYLAIYVIMNAAAFSIVLLIRKPGIFGEKVEDLRGLALQSPFMAACLVIILLSLTGIPPTAGFIGKYYLFAAAIGNGAWYLAVAGALNSVISLFYYFRIGRAMFMEPGAGDAHAGGNYLVKTAIAVFAAFILVVGILPSRLTELLASITRIGY